MADWKVPVPYNFNPAYHAFAYGLPYPTAPEQSHPNLNWTEASYNTGVNGGFYQAQAPQLSPPGSPKQMTTNAPAHYPGPMVYFSETHTQSGRLFLSQNRNFNQIYDVQRKENERPSSDSEAHTPDSWSSGSSREGCLPPENPATWIKKEIDDEAVSDSAEGAVVSSSFSGIGEDDCGIRDVGAAQDATKTSPQSQKQTRKDKRRTVFSVGQMDALTHRFSVQRYLTPAEMKTLANLTGLTYKQVKTWFQNRRMKLKRHQKEAWVSERYANTGYPNAQSSQFQADSQTILPDQYQNPQLREAVFKKSPPHPVPIYPNYMRPHSPSQPPARPQSSWPLPAGMAHYEYPSQGNFMMPSGNDTNDGNNGADAGSSPTQMGMVHSATQWSS